MDTILAIILILFFIAIIILYILLCLIDKQVENISYCLSRLEQDFKEKNNK